MCCGQKRTELRNSQTQRPKPSIPPYGTANSQAQPVRTQPSTPPVAQAVRPQHFVRQAQAGTAASTPPAPINVRYLEKSPIRVRGSVSGIYYEFSGSRAVQNVDARDAASLLNTRFFRRA